MEVAVAVDSALLNWMKQLGSPCSRETMPTHPIFLTKVAHAASAPQAWMQQRCALWNRITPITDPRDSFSLGNTFHQNSNTSSTPYTGPYKTAEFQEDTSPEHVKNCRPLMLDAKWTLILKMKIGKLPVMLWNHSRNPTIHQWSTLHNASTKSIETIQSKQQSNSPMLSRPWKSVRHLCITFTALVYIRTKIILLLDTICIVLLVDYELVILKSNV